MLFQTWTFLPFILVFGTALVLLKDTRWRLGSLLVGAAVFYGWSAGWGVVLLAWVVIADYLIVWRLARGGRPRVWVSVSVAHAVALLGLARHAGAVVDVANRGLAAIGSSVVLEPPGGGLTVGLSFYLLQSLGYAIDCAAGRVEREPSLARHAAFVTLFPLLLSGPIERAGRILPQIRRRIEVSAAGVAEGLSLFVVGLFKKVALADYLGLYVDQVYAAPRDHDATTLLSATLLYSWQIYLDFSGYSDMAQGVARAMGIRVMANFDRPYMATGLADFWRRWHISLSTWMRDMLFLPVHYRLSRLLERAKLPLAASDETSFVVAISATFLVIGLWHGVTWMFVLWGLFHGLGRVSSRRLEASRFYRRRVPLAVRRTLVFGFVSFAWILFRSPTWSDASAVISGIATGTWGVPRVPAPMLALIAAVIAYQAASESDGRGLLEWRPLGAGLVAAMVLYLAVFASSGSRPFIYLQF